MPTRAPWTVLFLAALALVVITARAADEKPIEKFDDPDAKSMATASTNRVVIEAGDADAKASLRIARLFDLAPQRYGRYAFTVSAPFDSKKADKVDVGTLSGLTAGSSATLELGALRAPKAGQAEQDATEQACIDAIPRLIPGYTWEQVGLLTSLNCNRDLLDKEKLAAAVKQINDRAETCARCRRLEGATPPLCLVLRDAYTEDCATGGADANGSAVCALLDAEQRKECAACKSSGPQEEALCAQLRGKAVLAKDVDKILAEVDANLVARFNDTFRSMQGVTFSVKANEQTFSFVTSDAPTATRKSSKAGYSVSLALTQVGRSQLWTAGYAYEKSFAASSKVQVCTPLGMSGALSCKDASIGAPRENTKQLAFLENRSIISTERLAVAPRLEYDLEESDWAVRVPLYFVLNKKKEFTAGLVLGYSDAQTDDDEFGATVFISKAFTFFD